MATETKPMKQADFNAFIVTEVYELTALLDSVAIMCRALGEADDCKGEVTQEEALSALPGLSLHVSAVSKRVQAIADAAMALSEREVTVPSVKKGSAS
jgi:hypothetical protein